MRRGGEHVDVRARAEDAVLPRGDDHRLDGRVGEPQPLQRVGQLDVHREVVRVAFQFICLRLRLRPVAGRAGSSELDLGVLASEGLHLHGEPGDLAVDRQGPVPVAARVRLERHLRGSGGLVHVRDKLAHRAPECKQYNA